MVQVIVVNLMISKHLYSKNFNFFSQDENHVGWSFNCFKWDLLSNEALLFTVLSAVWTEEYLEYSSGQFLERYLENLRNGRTLESTKTPAKHIKEFSQRCRMRHRDWERPRKHRLWKEREDWIEIWWPHLPAPKTLLESLGNKLSCGASPFRPLA